MIDFLEIFDLLPQSYMILSPQAPDFKILFVNGAYKLLSGRGNDIVGQPLFKVFPDNPDDVTASGVTNLTNSLMKVICTRQPHIMPIQRYDVKEPGSDEFVMRYWKPENIPVLNEQGGIKYIIHAVQEVTDTILLQKDIKHLDATAQKNIEDAVSTTQQMERIEISQELHDNINQLLNMSRLYLEYSMTTEPVNESLLKQGHGLVKKAMSEVHKMSKALMETSSEEKQLIEGLEEILNHVAELKQINVVKNIDLPDESMIEAKIKLAVMRIVQEQLSNVLKHSQAKNLYIDLGFTNGQLHLTIKDDGKGFSLNDHKPGLGFQNIRNRVAMINGSVIINSKPGDGCLIEIHSPSK